MLKFLIVIVFLGWILWLFYVSFDQAFGPERTPGSYKEHPAEVAQ